GNGSAQDACRTPARIGPRALVGCELRDRDAEAARDDVAVGTLAKAGGPRVGLHVCRAALQRRSSPDGATLPSPTKPLKTLTTRHIGTIRACQRAGSIRRLA